MSARILNEVYYPTIDRPQIWDMQHLVTDGETFCHDERRHTGQLVCYSPTHCANIWFFQILTSVSHRERSSL